GLPSRRPTWTRSTRWRLWWGLQLSAGPVESAAWSRWSMRSRNVLPSPANRASGVLPALQWPGLLQFTLRPSQVAAVPPFPVPCRVLSFHVPEPRGTRNNNTEQGTGNWNGPLWNHVCPFSGGVGLRGRHMRKAGLAAAALLAVFTGHSVAVAEDEERAR